MVRLLSLIGTVAAALSVTAVVPAILPVFDGGGLIPLLLATLLPLAVAAVARAAPARLAGYAAVGAILLAALPGGALGALGSGGARLVTGSLPAPASGPAFGIAVALTYLAAAIAVEAARTRRSALAPLAPGGALLALALLVGAGGLPQPRWAGALFVTAGAGALLAFQLRPVAVAAGRSRAPLARVPTAAPVLARRVLSGAAVTAAVGLLALPLGSALPGAHARRPYDLRSVVAPAPHPLNQIGLLSTYAATYDGSVAPAFTAQVSGANPQALYWRLAVFDTFNGEEWTSSVVYQRAGTRLPAGPHLAVGTTTVHARVEPASLPGYVPAPDRPEAVSVAGLGVGGSDGELVIPASAHLPASVDITSEVPDPAPDQLLQAGIPAGATNQSAPPVPPAIADLAGRLAATARPYPFARLTALSDYLTGAPFRLHPPGDSPIGAGYYQVTQLLQDHVGSTETYAAAFAVLARVMGFHTRLAMGYEGGTVRAGTVLLTTRDLKVWPEVEFSGVGWLPFPAWPAGQGAKGATSRSPAPNPIAQALQNQRQINRTTPQPEPTNGGQGLLPRLNRPSDELAWWVWLLAAAAAAAAASVGSLVAAKAIRRRRQRGATDPGARLVGAWEYTLDRLGEHGLALPASLTAPEIADRAGARFTGVTAPMRTLAPAVDAVRYNRGAPVLVSTPDEGWAAAREVQAALRSGSSLGTRVRAWVSTAPLMRRRAD